MRLTKNLRNAIGQPLGLRGRRGWLLRTAAPPTYLLGIRIDRLTVTGLLSTVISRAKQNTRTTVLYVNAHCMNVQYTDSIYRNILNAANIVYCDGTGVRIAAWLAGRHIPSRMTGADWIDGLCNACAVQDVSLYFLGGMEGSASEAARVLQARNPRLRITDTAPGYELNAGVIDKINRSRPDILLVGLGTPRQEKWIATHREELDVPVVWAVGALFDFASGRIPRGPKWMTDHGLEWVCRLAAEPKKLWRRYLIGNPVFIARVIRRHWLGRRLPSGEDL